ncbi:endocuticle structural glycoprotein SgAbd-4-like isoform X1 [Daphnia carinata]|uniref:endocuticle structural glycoprotein SgAbd-4-like isoform X1 n=1 Tax=Daphnia carinata TaxID=120202 RepID=UPI00257B669F|nr:endocuticle structural glycoprotein SgAbd-4-like isoform X1 [Daphnia carinata]
MKLFMIAALLAVAAAAPSSYKKDVKAPSYPAPSYSAPKYSAPAYSAPAYPAPAYSAPAYSAPAYSAPAYKDNNYADITVTSQSDVRNLDGSSQWSYAQSDYTTREESQVQKKMQGVAYDSYGKATYEDVIGNTNKGSSYWISPEGQKFTLTWIADKNGFQPKGDHLPVAPVHVYELPVAPVHEYVLPVAPALPYSRTGLGY